MTPLAYRIVKQTWLPLKHREPFDDGAGLLKNGRMDDIHCFEMSDVFVLADDLGYKWHEASKGEDGRYKAAAIDTTFAFLPAPKTWLEWTGDWPGQRQAFLIEEAGDLALCTYVNNRSGLFSYERPMVMQLRAAEEFQIRWDPQSRMRRDEQITFLYRLYAMLALINSPRVIGRRTHPPHKSLAKKFAVGKFPLHAWTEITLEVNRPVKVYFGEASNETHLSGRQALHFCRAYVRIRRGRLEYVSSYWSGDPAIGIKRSRYTIIKTKQPSNANGTANA